MKKILLIHGWNYTNYTSFGCTNAWANRSGFINDLQKHFEVKTFNLPGFCGTADPLTAWDLDDFVDYVDHIIRSEKPDYVLGYSFGGAIALRWKFLHHDTLIKTFLVSPAIIRHYVVKNPKGLQTFFKALFPEKLVHILRDFYLSYIRKNPYYSNATKVMQESYRSIVTEDLQDELVVLEDSVTLIYGSKDTATPPEFIQHVVAKSIANHKLEIIFGGGHDIANSHTQQLISLITKTEV